jgi:hypothetical protein
MNILSSKLQKGAVFWNKGKTYEFWKIDTHKKIPCEREGVRNNEITHRELINSTRKRISTSCAFLSDIQTNYFEVVLFSVYCRNLENTRSKFQWSKRASRNPIGLLSLLDNLCWIYSPIRHDHLKTT